MIKIIYLGGRKNGQFEMVSSMNLLQIDRGYDTKTENNGSSITTSQNAYTDEYYLKLVKRGNELKAFYIFKDLESNEVKKLSKDHWDETYSLGYEFD